AFTLADSTVCPHSSHFWNSPDGTERFLAASGAPFLSLVRDHHAMSGSEALLHIEELEELIELARLGDGDRAEVGRDQARLLEALQARGHLLRRRAHALRQIVDGGVDAHARPV